LTVKVLAVARTDRQFGRALPRDFECQLLGAASVVAGFAPPFWRVVMRPRSGDLGQFSSERYRAVI